MDIAAAEREILKLAERFEHAGFDLPALVIKLAAQGRIAHECGPIIGEVNEALSRGCTSLLNPNARAAQ